MNNKKTRLKIILAAITAGVVIISAAAAMLLYRQSSDSFTNQLASNLAKICSNSDLSKTQIRMIECAEIKNVKYDTSNDGNKKFYAEVRLFNPKVNCGSYSGENPQEYVKKAVDLLYDSNFGYVKCEIIGLCVDDKPVIDAETLNRLVACVQESWNGGQNLLENRHLSQAISDMLCPSPYDQREYTGSTEYTPAYNEFLDSYSVNFAADGVKINGETSNDPAAIRSVMAKVLTPYYCSAKNVSLSASSTQSGMLSFSFDSLNIIEAISQAKKSLISSENEVDINAAESQIFSAITSASAAYSEDTAFKCSMNIDLTDFADSKASGGDGYYGTIRAFTEYYSSSAYDAATNRSSIKKINTSCVISGKGNGMWPVEFKRNAGDGDAIISIVKISDNGEESSVAKLYLTDGGSDIICLAQGQYRLNIAVGENYFGAKQLFGDDGIYFKDNTVFQVTATNSVTVIKHKEENLSLIDYILDKNNGGSCIDKSAF